MAGISSIFEYSEKQNGHVSDLDRLQRHEKELSVVFRAPRTHKLIKAASDIFNHSSRLQSFLRNHACAFH
jgi:hypothetical protein